MSELITSISEQVTSCKKLLQLFQDERKFYQMSKKVGVKEVKTILERKKLIVSAFEKQHNLIKELKAENPALNSEEDRLQKENLRVLGALLEQLLVIDHENEKLLRKILSPNSMPATGTVKGTSRPSLQKQRPFVPGGQTASVASRPSVVANAPKASAHARRASTASTAAPASNRLSKYAPKQVQYESKYA